MMAQLQSPQTVNEGESTIPDIQVHLQKHGFKQYNKIAAAVENGEITVEDLVQCSETDLSQLCQEYGIGVIQKNRFISAIKALPNAKSSEKNTKKQNTPFVFLTAEEQNTMNKFDSMKREIKQMIENIKEISLANETGIGQRKEIVNQECDKLIQFINVQRKEAIEQVEIFFYFCVSLHGIAFGVINLSLCM